MDSTLTLLSSPETITTVIAPSQTVTATTQGVQSIALTIVPPASPKTVLGAGQGPAGPPGGAAVSYLGKTLEWAGPVLTRVLLYADSAKTSLEERRELHYDAGGRLEYVEHFNGAGTLLFTRVLQYVDGVLVGTTTA